MKAKTLKQSKARQESSSLSFTPYDNAWKKEVMKNRKVEIVDILKRVCNERDCAIEENHRILMGLESATIRRHHDGSIELVDAPDVFACSRQCLEQLIALIPSQNRPQKPN